MRLMAAKAAKDKSQETDVRVLTRRHRDDAHRLEVSRNG